MAKNPCNPKKKPSKKKPGKKNPVRKKRMIA